VLLSNIAWGAGMGEGILVSLTELKLMRAEELIMLMEEVVKLRKKK
jgi:hypothetical protein